MDSFAWAHDFRGIGPNREGGVALSTLCIGRQEAEEMGDRKKPEQESP